MAGRSSGLVVGGTGSGKTTLLNVACDYIPDTERLITVEDTHELQSNVPNIVHLEAPQRRQKDNGQVVDMPYLIKTSLRLDPTRIIVGEIRDGEAAAAFLRAINTGHCACSTIHANGPQDALTRIQTEVAGYAKLPFDVVRAQVRANLNFLIFCEDTPLHGRRVVSISEIVDQQVVELWRWDYEKGEHVKTGHEPRLYRDLSKYGITL
jgi:pilus assembly protein CpaF